MFSLSKQLLNPVFGLFSLDKYSLSCYDGLAIGAAKYPTNEFQCLQKFGGDNTMFLNRSIVVFFVLSLFTVITLAYGAGTVIFEEDFDGLELGPTIAEAVPEDEVWTDVPPDGWSIVDDLADGMPEWTGWAFADGDWWMRTAGDQQRNQFINGKAFGTIAIADPDEWDDLGGPAGTFNSWLSTPEINVTGVVKDSMILTFDSSWRPEDTQNAELTVSFDGGDEILIMRMQSQGTNTLYSEPENNFEDTFADLQQVNETMEIGFPSPAGAKTLVITWSVIDATNDWWWAIDNISLRSTEKVAVENNSEKLSALWGKIKANK